MPSLSSTNASQYTESNIVHLFVQTQKRHARCSLTFNPSLFHVQSTFHPKENVRIVIVCTVELNITSSITFKISLVIYCSRPATYLLRNETVWPACKLRPWGHRVSFETKVKHFRLRLFCLSWHSTLCWPKYRLGNFSTVYGCISIGGTIITPGFE